MNKRSIVTGALVFSAGFCVASLMSVLPVWAIDASDVNAPFVDKDFEVALRKHFQKRFFNLIDANDDQRKQISAILEQRFDELQPQREKLRSEAVDLSKLMASDAADQKIVDKAHEMRTMLEKLMDERLTTALKIRTLLKPEQRRVVSDRITSLLNGSSKFRMLR